MKTNAAVMRSSDGPFRIEEVHLADLEPDEVLVRIVGVGVCHTDLSMRKPGNAGRLVPAILGHEGAGVVEAVGTGVTVAAPGDHVILTFDSCGTCVNCLQGRPAYCFEFMTRNTSARSSATSPTGEPINNRWFGQSSFAKHAVATQRNVVVIDPDLPLELLGPLGCGVLTGAGAVLNEMRLLAGQSIVVFGAGAVGLSAIMAARAAGANDIVAVDVNLARLRLAEELGATRTFQAGTEDLVARVRGKSTGVDFAFDTTGVPSAMRAAIETLTMPGKAVFVGAGNDLTIPPMLLAGRTLTYVLEGSAVPRVLIPHLLDLWRAGAFPFEKMITTFPLSEINQAEHACRNGEVVKPVLLP